MIIFVGSTIEIGRLCFLDELTRKSIQYYQIIAPEFTKSKFDLPDQIELRSSVFSIYFL